MLQNLRLASSLLSGHPQLSVHRRAQNSQDQGGRHCHPLLFLPLKEQTACFAYYSVKSPKVCWTALVKDTQKW